MYNTNSKEIKLIKLNLSEKRRTKLNCKDCGKQMANKGSLYTHIRAVHEGIRNVCQQCL